MKLKDIFGVALVALALTVAGSGIYAVQLLKAPKSDPETLCPLVGPSGITLVIIDKTDPLKPADGALVNEVVAAERDALAVGAKIAVFILAQKPGAKRAASERIVALCKPQAEANRLFENPRKVLARYEQAFAAPLDHAIEALKHEGTASNSPIAESIKSAIESEAIAIEGAKRLVLITDLMEHTPAGSAYGGSFSKATLRRLLPAASQAWLKNARIEITLLARGENAARQEAATSAWLAFFKEIGAAPSLSAR